ncbi:tRNA (adenosine(37)-N6)-threonylcarbamoyltransferase complex transferase subunit TsaD [Kiloniella laminariae]|uniref:tRNA N6-adenosine threonylcarbamoyltransferase n=1 Tax=Kiloniella laminariae TaxID=454162 RepID=A0ABT4LJ13_9PROT|nr:tRNA (adenosine(37)-N6)-threonylcarbamoyltransferase complex transferase subunit TsaD [Kiloniella laminariae]MCZ4281084.1 tRNA (adenosine(37)-N6)-threonylcarbamoyltransferase complex transferase subunit TsaD [Kiloniella laminariae]
MKVLGIETSCDETAAAIVDSDHNILANRVLSQLEEHEPYGGVVPEIAARSHMDHLDRLIREALEEARLGFEDLDGIAATAGPGLIGGVFVGVMTAKAIAAARKLPFLAVNHLEGHALTARLTEGEAAAFPYLLLLVSGGHCQLLAVEAVGCYSRLGGTIDDAVGEAFDKTAKMMGLPYPGGPLMEQIAKKGDPERFDLPRPMKGRPGCDFSFSGLKTAVRNKILELAGEDGAISNLTDQDKSDLAASFQAAVGDVLIDRCSHAMDLFQARYGRPGPLVVAGGVAANLALRDRLTALTDQRQTSLLAPPVKLCTDNGVMIAWAGLERLQLGLTDSLDFAPRPRWPLDQLTGVKDRA